MRSTLPRGLSSTASLGHFGHLVCRPVHHDHIRFRNTDHVCSVLMRNDHEAVFPFPVDVQLNRFTALVSHVNDFTHLVKWYVGDIPVLHQALIPTIRLNFGDLGFKPPALLDFNSISSEELDPLTDLFQWYAGKNITLQSLDRIGAVFL